MLLAQGIPDSAFEPIEGDDKKMCSEYRKRNRQQREGSRSLFDPTGEPWGHLDNLAADMRRLEEIGDDTVKDIHRKQEYYDRLVQSQDYLAGRLQADAWCAAFVWKKNGEFAYPITEEVFHTIEENPESVPPWMRDEIFRLREQYQFFHWHLAFPDVFRVSMKGETPENDQAGWSSGFDAVLGNPPWENTTLKEQEWFASYHPDIAQAEGAKRKRMIEALAANDPALYSSFHEALRHADGVSHLVRNTGRYPLCGHGQINTYALFAETNRLLLGYAGRIGCIVPSGIATDDTTKFFFRNLVESRMLVSLYSFENEEFIFPAVHHATKFCLLTISDNNKPQQAADFVFFARQIAHLQEEDRHFSLSATDIALLNPNTFTCPTFRFKRDLELNRAIYHQVPVLIKEGPPEVNPWGFKVYMMFHMTNDSHLFRPREQLEADGWVSEGNVLYKGDEVYMPLYEGKMVSYFDHQFGTYKGQTQAQANQGKLPELTEEQHADPTFLSIPHG